MNSSDDWKTFFPIISEEIVTVGPGELDLDLKKILRIGKVFAYKDVLCMSYIYLLYCLALTVRLTTRYLVLKLNNVIV